MGDGRGEGIESENVTVQSINGFRRFNIDEPVKSFSRPCMAIYPKGTLLWLSSLEFTETLFFEFSGIKFQLVNHTLF